MDFEEFRLQLMDDIKSDLEDRTGENYSVEKTNVNKLQNAGYEGIVIKPEGAERIIEKGFANQPAFSVDDLRNYDIMKEKLAIRVVSTERNAETLENIPHKEVEDMSMRIHPEEKKHRDRCRKLRRGGCSGMRIFRHAHITHVVRRKGLDCFGHEKLAVCRESVIPNIAIYALN